MMLREASTTCLAIWISPRVALLWLLTDGTEQELYVYYEAGYEKTRVWNGYCFSQKDRGHWLEVIAAEYLEDVEEMYFKYSAAEVKACVDFFFGLFPKESSFADSVMRQALTVAVVLQ